MTKDLGAWTAQDCALVLIDYQNEIPPVMAEVDGVEPIDRSSMNAFEDETFRQAAQATGRRWLTIGGLHTEICLTSPAVPALKDGYDVLYAAEVEKRGASDPGGH